MPSWLGTLWRKMRAMLPGVRGTAHEDAPDAPSVGKQGEEIAAAHLRRSGYTILQRNVKSRFGEIDIVASHGDVLCFVEVKTRRSERFGYGATAVGRSKQRQIVKASADFARKHGMLDADCRFDVVAVTLPPQGEPTVEVFEGAFASTSRI